MISSVSVNEVPEKSVVRYGYLVEDEVTSCNTAARKEDCAWSKRVKKYGGHFSAPFPIAIRHKYFHNDVAERSPATLEPIPEYAPNSKNMVLLKVGMTFFTDFMEGVRCFRKYTIGEFYQGSIHLTLFLVIPI